jgi:DNA-binding IclR family transcriptional regulator
MARMARTSVPSTRGELRRRRPKVRADGPASGGSGDRYASRTVERALDVLEAFDDGAGALSLTELSARISLPISSLFRLLVTLEQRGFLIQDGDGTYRLSPRVLFGRVRERADRLRERLQPTLQMLARTFNETASLAYRFGDVIQVLDTVESFHEIRATNRVGRVLPPHCSSLGKAITAFQTPEQRDRILESYGLIRRTPRTIVDRQAIEADFQAIRERGYAVDRGEAMEGGVCVGAPVLLAPGVAGAAISVSIPEIRATDEREREIVARLREVTREISAELTRSLETEKPDKEKS